MKFGISFTATWHNQAGALVHVYRDGSVHLSHGGTEMGQGLHIKVAQVVADAFGIPLDRVKITASNTGKVPNTSATAASSGTDLNGMAALDGGAARSRRAWPRMRRKCTRSSRTRGGCGSSAASAPASSSSRSTNSRLSCWMNRVQLSAAGFYTTPKIHWDRATGTRPSVLLFRLWRGRAPR